MDNILRGAESRRHLSIAELARMVSGRLIGAPDEGTMISGTCAIDGYVRNKVSFVKNRKYGELLAMLENAVVLVPESLLELCERYSQNTYVVVADVMNALIDVQDFFYQDQSVLSSEGVSPTAVIDSGVAMGSRVFVGDYVHIGRGAVLGDRIKIMHGCYILDHVSIGRNTLLYPGVYVHHRCQIGNDCIIHPGVCIGVDGQRFEQDFDRKLVRKMLHAGAVIIGDRVEVGANCTIVRSTFEDENTVICDDVKIGHLVHIPHNSRVGARSIVVTKAGMAGSVEVGEDAWIGIGATISNGVTIGNRARVLLNAVVAYDVPEGEVVSGFYAMPHTEWKRVYARLKEI